MQYFIEFGYVGLFVSAFLAATILPLSSELVLGALLVNDLSPITLIVIATLGNVLGSLINYALGYWANGTLIQKWLRLSNESLQHAEQRFQHYGLVSLCFAWVPIIGDPLTVVAGALRIHLFWFVLLVGLGKMIRYIVMAYAVLNVS